MKFCRRIICFVQLTLFLPSLGYAHSLKNVEDQLYEKEQYVQVFDKKAPDFDLENSDGYPIKLTGFRGKVVILNFIYARCPDVCPLHSEKIAEIQQMVNITPMRDQVEFVTVTTDPKNDTADVLRTYGKAHGLDSLNWKFLTSGPDSPLTTRDLVKKFGHKFMATEDGYQVHSVVTHIIDREGNWRANFFGLKFQSTSLVMYVNALVNDVHGADRARMP